MYEKNHTFFILIGMEDVRKIKNIKIDTRVHNLLKQYCKKNGLKMFHFVEKLIKEKCSPKKDIYGDL
tara:strand:+ start:183 stop:383 length:201 start_codon:yes stop_codon:yes gene_type:complete